ncbi:hypothetical protein L1987_68397 [Smallanthus sonchifolius]|uniref:Uncharacterized protein n=1 Tax=Smallanthus sonchifolius TaxID=185202 RepID=A0ACB9B3X0_9ASTR|nr:hypothetical protein L1987_68397 [Smallanthus sonchifolius]
MVLGWRRVFCTSIPPEEIEYEHDVSNTSSKTPKCRGGFGFFNTSSSPSTPRLRCRTEAPRSPETRYQTKNSPRFFLTSPRAFLKTSLRLYTRRCGLCLQSVKKGQGMATFTAECSHTFHFPCISDHVKTQGSLACPMCSSLWKEMPLLSVSDRNRKDRLFDEENTREKLVESPIQQLIRPDLKVYNDDEPLACLTPKARFNPIPESDENCDEEFQGFWINGGDTSPGDSYVRDVEVRMLPEAALITASRRHETYAVVLKVKAPAVPEKAQRRAPIDLVTVVDVSGKITNNKLEMIKNAMRSIILALSSSDRLSIVAFSSHSKRLLPLGRMTTSGRRAARCIVEAMAVLDGTSNSKDAVKKAVKVLLDRREKNTVAAVILLSDFLDQSSSVSSIRYSHSRLDIKIHSLKLAGIEDLMIGKCIGNILNVVVQDLRLQLGFISGSDPAVIAAVYSRTPQPVVLGSGTIEIGELSAGEEKELLVELKAPLPAAVRCHRVLSVRCCYREPLTQEIIYGNQQTLTVPRLTTVRSSSPAIQRQRNIFISTRALAESRRLTEGNDLTGAHQILVSARALLKQYNPPPDNEFIHRLEAELNELQRRRKVQAQAQHLGWASVAYRDERGEPLTPQSAWRMADKLAKVAMMRKSVNRVGDLHGFEDARF